MSEMHVVKVMKKNNSVVVLKLWQVHPDAGGFQDESLQAAMRLLRDPSNRAVRGSAIEAAFDVDQFLDEASLFRKSGAGSDQAAQKYVASFRRLETTNWPAPPSAAEADDFWPGAGAAPEDLERVPQAMFELTAADERWVAHLKRGDTWDSATYS